MSKSQGYFGLPKAPLASTGMNLIWSSKAWSSPLPFVRYFMVTKVREGWRVNFDNHPDHSRVKRWFEARKLIVRRDRLVPGDIINGGGYYVYTDKDTATLAKLMWGGI